MKVHSRGPSQADVTEGSSGIWERLHYDLSDPNPVVLKSTDSNTWGASGHTYTFAHCPDGLTDIDFVTGGWDDRKGFGEGVQELGHGY